MRRRTPTGLIGATGLTIVVMMVVGATGVTAASCPNENLRLATHSALLPDCRAYELVTPPFKEGASVPLLFIPEHGSHLIGGALGIFAGAEQNTSGAIHTETGGTGAIYEFVRGEGGWSTKPIFAPPASQFPSAGMQSDASLDLATTLWKLRAPSQLEGEGDLYRRESNGSFVHLGPLQPPGGPLFGEEGIYAGASPDFKRVLIRKEPTEGRWPGDTTTGNESLYEYEGVEEVEPKLVGVKNNGGLVNNGEAQLVSECGTVLGSPSSNDTYNAISENGESVFFTALECGSPAVNELYARIGGARTVAISEPILPAGQCTGVCATAEHREGLFAGAAIDGSKVFFMTEQPLLNGDKDMTSDLYEAELEGGAVKRLAMISEGETKAGAVENDQTPGEGANVQGVARVSEDGSRVYFVATGELTKVANVQGDHAEAGADNLYVADTLSGRIAFIAKLSNEDKNIWQRVDSGRPVALTPDGRFLVLVSRADLTHEGASPGQVYEYDAQSGILTRLSLGQHSSSAGLGPSIVTSAYAFVDAVTASHSTLTMSNDGSYVFFQSPDGLTPQASDDREGIKNIYEYHSGRVSLISDGRDDSSLRGTDPTGSDVYFSTAAPLISQDSDTQSDIYDARSMGGFPATVGQAGCSGEACRPLGSTPPLPVPGSSTQAGGDNAQPAPALPASVRGHKKVKRKPKPKRRKAHAKKSMNAITIRRRGRS